MSGWFSVQRMSVARAASIPGASEPARSSVATIAPWFAWKSVWINAQSAPISSSLGAASLMTPSNDAMRSFTAHEATEIRRAN